MALETATYISQLNINDPVTGDGVTQGADHLRLVKSVLQNCFPGLAGPLTVSSGGILIPGATDGSGFTPDKTNGGFVITSRLKGQGAVPIGMIMDFAGTTAPQGWLACDGQSLSTTTYAELFAAIGYIWGGTGTSFNIPNLMSGGVGRFRRHRDTSAYYANGVGNLQNSVNLAHTHGVSGNTGTESANHSHSFSGTTGSMNQNASHSHSSNAAENTGGSGTGGGSFALNAPGAATISATNTDHQHSFSGTTSAESVAHSHSFNVTSGGGSSDSAYEARPYSATVLACIRAL